MHTCTLIERAKLNLDVSIIYTIGGHESIILLIPVQLSEIQQNKDVEWEQNPGYNSQFYIINSRLINVFTLSLLFILAGSFFVFKAF